MAFVTFSLSFLVGCQKRADEAPPVVDNAKVVALTADYDAALARKDYVVAELLGRLITQRWPGSASARRVLGGFAVVVEQAEKQRERKRLADLWTWHAVPHTAGKGVVYTGFIWAVEPGAPHDPMFRLVLRNHPEWGNSAYLLHDRSRPATSGLLSTVAAESRSPWNCPPPVCEIQIRFDAGPTHTYSAYEPDEVGTSALFIVEYDALVDAMEQAHWMQIEAGLIVADPNRVLRLEVGGFNRSRLAADSTHTPEVATLPE